jgi:hypothetical protein
MSLERKMRDACWGLVWTPQGNRALGNLGAEGRIILNGL